MLKNVKCSIMNWNIVFQKKKKYIHKWFINTKKKKFACTFIDIYVQFNSIIFLNKNHLMK